MPQSLVTNLMHLVYSTKHRVPCIREDLRAKLYAYQAGIFTEWESPADFHWQTGYAAFSVSESNVQAVRKYISNQEKHHQKMSIQDELRLLLERHKLKFDERYVWD